MGYATGGKVLGAVIEDIAAGLIATTGSHWTDADVTWTTTDKSLNNAKRALKYSNTDEEIYIALEAINQTNGYLVYATYYAKGLRITFSTGWDGTGHVPSGTIVYSFVQFEARITSSVVMDLATAIVSYSLWIEPSGDGFVILGVPEANATDDRQQSFFVCIERNTNKEYADGYSNFAYFGVMNYDNFHSTSYASNLRMKNYIRPFNFVTPSDTWSSYNYQSGRDAGGAIPGSIPYCGEDYGIKFPSIGEVPVTNIKAFKSTATGVVYFVKPIAMNTRDTRSPIFQFESFFPWTENVGLVDGDIITVDGTSDQYICRSLNSPDSTTNLTFAIRYA